MRNKFKKILGIAAAAAVIGAVTFPLGSGISYAEDTASEQIGLEQEADLQNVQNESAEEAGQRQTGAESAESAENTPAYDPVQMNLIVEVELDGDFSKGFDRDKSKNQFAIRMYEPGGTDENGRFKDILLPKDTPDEDNPDTNFEEAPGKIVVPVQFSEPGTYEYRFREISPKEGLKDSEGKPMPEDTPDMSYDDSELKSIIEIKERDGKLIIYADSVIELSGGSFWGVGTFSNYSNKPEIASAKVFASGKTGTIEFKEGSSYTLSEKVEFKNLKPGQTYTIESLVFKGFEPFDSAVNEITADTGVLDITFKNIITQPDEYNIVTLIKQNNEIIKTNNGNFDAEEQKVILNPPKEAIPEDEEVIDPIHGCP